MALPSFQSIHLHQATKIIYLRNLFVFFVRPQASTHDSNRDEGLLGTLTFDGPVSATLETELVGR